MYSLCIIFLSVVSSGDALRLVPRMEISPLSKGAWVAAEMYGNIFGKGVDKTEEVVKKPPRSKKELISRLAADNEEVPPYFLGGKFDALAYAEDCIFADPFVSFEGRDRFQANLANLGGFITESYARSLGEAESNDDFYYQKFLVKLRLNLPWSPVLAWPWGVKYVIGRRAETDFVVIEHIESWDVSPEEGIRQLFRPGRKAKVVPTEKEASSTVNSTKRRRSQQTAVNKLGTSDPIAGPLVAAARSFNLMEDDGNPEPLAWADADSIPQRFSMFSQTVLPSFKQFAADLVAGDYDQLTIDTRIDDFITSQPLTLFTFSTCPFCIRAKQLLDDLGASYTTLDLDLVEDGAAIRAQLGRRTGRTSVPSIWINREYLGGLNDGNPGLAPLNDSGDLLPRLKAAGALL